MLSDNKIPEQVTQPEESPEFNWRHFWYPVTFAQDMPKDQPLAFSLYDEPLVLFRDKNGQLGCLVDRCSHRAAKLSDGQIIDGKLECLYHGWQFGIDGKCLHIPQLPENAKIPVKACVKSLPVVERQGIIWVWAGEPKNADLDRIPTIAELENQGFVHTDFILDIPYDQSYLVENLLDPAHIHISHAGTQGNRKKAQPLEIEIIENSAWGIRGKWRGTQNPKEVWKDLNFIAPNLIHSIINFERQDWSMGIAFYVLPLGQRRCRLLLRAYRNFASWVNKLKPSWLYHFNMNKILEEDLPLIVGQESQIEKLGKSLKELYLPLKTSDTLVIEYRKWLDKFGSNLPFYEGYSTSKRARDRKTENEHPVLQDRFSRHTRICTSCNQTYQLTNKLKQALVAMAVGIAALGIVIDGNSSQKLVTVLVFMAAVCLAGIAQIVKTKFERSYVRSYR